MQAQPEQSNASTLRVIAIGGAGARIAAQLAPAWTWGSILVCDCDVHSLQTSAPEISRHQIAATTLRGLGAGGDPDLARNGADAEADALRKHAAGAEVVMIIAGLGRGTGSGVAPLMARLAKETGALVLAFVVQPFPMEGRRASQQAMDAEAELRRHADAVIGLPNAGLLAMAGNNTSLAEAFAVSNQMLCDAVGGVARMICGRGLLPVSLAEIRTAVRGDSTECVMATANGSGDKRIEDAVAALMAHPFLNRGAALEGATGVVAAVTGGPELGLHEIAAIMEPINTRTNDAPVILGATADPAFAGRVSITLIVARPVEESVTRETPALAVPSAAADTSIVPDAAIPRRAAGSAASRPGATANRGRAGRAVRGGPRLTQEQLALDSVAKGRFEKSEPTILHGEDLDTPTFVRRGVALN